MLSYAWHDKILSHCGNQGHMYAPMKLCTCAILYDLGASAFAQAGVSFNTGWEYYAHNFTEKQ